MRLGWIGVHQEGLPALRAVLEAGYRVEALITFAPAIAARCSGAADYRGLCAAFGVPVHTVASINDDQARALLSTLALDLAFVIGWTQIVRRETRDLVRVGMIGAHASMLPANRGRAPINWALIHGCTQTGNSLIWLADDVDSGDLIAQTRIPISPYDTCASLYERVAASNRDLILAVLPQLVSGGRPGVPQTAPREPPLPGRRPADGLIDWSRPAQAVYDFVRALTRPYPGAFSSIDGARYVVWRSALLPAACRSDLTPGEVLGPMVSPVAEACGQTVATGCGDLVLLELEDDQGRTIAGRELSERARAWQGKVWT
jgi:methionyl-tRNA formyltransferase